MTHPPPPEASGALYVAVHRAALRSEKNLHTQLVAFSGTELVWAGAFDENNLTPDGKALPASPRAILRARLLKGSQLWSVVRPEALTASAAPDGCTIYGGIDWHTVKFRPWIVIGELSNGHVIAIPLNEAPVGKAQLWFTPFLRRDELWTDAPKDSMAELAHVWSFPPSSPFRSTLPAGQSKLRQAVERYFGADSI